MTRVVLAPPLPRGNRTLSAMLVDYLIDKAWKKSLVQTSSGWQLWESFARHLVHETTASAISVHLVRPTPRRVLETLRRGGLVKFIR